MESGKLDEPVTTYPVSGDHEVVKPRFEAASASPSPSCPPCAGIRSEQGSGSPHGGGDDSKNKGGDDTATGKVWINPTQYFGNVPKVAWEFYIGGYQPAQKWLKDRKGRNLSVEDIRHYQRIIVALTETDRIMKDIDKIKFC